MRRSSIHVELCASPVSRVLSLPSIDQGLTIHLSFPFPGEVSWPFAQGCDPYPPIEKPCELGKYVSYSINVTGADDVVAGIKFAKANNIRLVIKNTGHE